MIHGLLDSLAQQINIKVAASETVDVVIRRFERCKLLPLLLCGGLLMLAVAEIVHYVRPYLCLPVKTKI